MAKKKNAGDVSAKPSKADRKAAKKAAAARPGGKRSRVLRPVQGRGFAIFGLLALLPIAVLLLQGRLDLEAAAQRAGLVLVGLILLERVIAPVVLAVLTSGERKSEPQPVAGDDDSAQELTPAEN